MLDTNSIFSKLSFVSSSPQQFLSALGSYKVEIQNKLVVEHVFLASVCSCSHIDCEQKK